jgi:hypothetical protein
MTNMNDARQKVSDTYDNASDYAGKTADKVTEIGERIESGMRDAGQKVRSEISEAHLSEATIPDAFRKVPKLVSPRVHAWLDFAVTTYFLGLGVWFAMRGKGRAAAAAFVNGGMVAGVSMFTDYDGDGIKPISFKLHGTLDAVQATTAALVPPLLGFAGESEAKYFFGQAANEVGVISTTDWDAGMVPEWQREAA